MKIGEMTPKELLVAVRQAERDNFKENWEDKLTPMPVSRMFHPTKTTDTLSIASPVNFQPEALSIAPECAPYFALSAVFVGQEPQTASTQYEMACSLLTTREPMRFSSLCVGQSVILQLLFRPPTKTVQIETYIPPKGKKRKGETVLTTRIEEQAVLFSAIVWGRFQRKLFNRSFE